MNHFSKRGGNKKKSIVYMILAFILLFSVAVFGQVRGEENLAIGNVRYVNNDEDMKSIKQESNLNISNINFVLWFMGAKQNPDTIISPAGSTGKKQLITSGTALNRLLIQTFLKKAINFESVVV